MKISQKVAAIYDRLDGGPLNPVWISLVPRDSALARAHEIENSPQSALAGMTFAVSDSSGSSRRITSQHPQGVVVAAD